MKNVNKTVLYSVASLLALTTTACSVQENKVANEPPDLRRGVNKFSAEYGTLDLDAQSISVFLWPLQSETELSKTVETVSRASRTIDHLYMQIAANKIALTKLEKQFQAAECIDKWADLGGEDPLMVNWVNAWKPGAPQKECVDNQPARKELRESLQLMGTKLLPEAAGALYLALDPGYPKKVENMKSINAKDSQITLNPDGSASIVLRDFLVAGNNHSTVAGTSTSNKGLIQKAFYVSPAKALMFDVPETDVSGESTGRVWQFRLERAPDFLGKVRFVGSIIVLQNGAPVRSGSAKIEAAFK